MEPPEAPSVLLRSLGDPPFSARKEPEIDETATPGLRAVLALGVVNLVLAAVGIVIAAGGPLVR